MSRQSDLRRETEREREREGEREAETEELSVACRLHVGSVASSRCRQIGDKRGLQEKVSATCRQRDPAPGEADADSLREDEVEEPTGQSTVELEDEATMRPDASQGARDKLTPPLYGGPFAGRAGPT